MHIRAERHSVGDYRVGVGVGGALVWGETAALIEWLVAGRVMALDRAGRGKLSSVWPECREYLSGAKSWRIERGKGLCGGRIGGCRGLRFARRATDGRRCCEPPADFRGKVWAYMAGIAGGLNMRAVRVGGYFDHAHLLVQIPAKMAVSDAVRLLKANTSRHINEERLSPYRFSWQDGYGAFTVSRSSVELVVAYIDRQLEHHRERSFQEEFLKMLADHGVEYDAKYLWE